MNESQYVIQVVVNPQMWGTGDRWIKCINRDELDYWLKFYRESTIFPNLNDTNLRDNGYKGFAVLELRVFEVKEIDNVSLREVPQ